jgi:hypothetical protein
MDIRRRREQLERDHDAARFHFIATELDLALTFCEIAIKADNERKAERAAEHAKEAYEAAMRFLPGAHLAPRMNQEIQESLKRLKPRMRQLGERVALKRLP